MVKAGKEAGKGAACASCVYESPVGLLTLAADKRGLRGLWIEGQKYFGGTVEELREPMPRKRVALEAGECSQPRADAHAAPAFGEAAEAEGGELVGRGPDACEDDTSCDAARAHLGQACAWLDSYFAGEQPDPVSLSLAPAGSTFQQVVWRLLLEIPYGSTTTYGELAVLAAQRVGREHMSAQAVGGAVGHNPVSIIIPCHRVVGASGSLTGYAGGVSRKLWLLEHEGVDCAGFFIPTRGTAL